MPDLKRYLSHGDRDSWYHNEVDTSWRPDPVRADEDRFVEDRAEWISTAPPNPDTHPALPDLLRELQEALDELPQNHGDPGRAPPVAADVQERAERFLRALPAHFSAPDIVIHPGGKVALEWLEGRRWVFTVAVGADPGITYAGLFEEARVSGREVFDRVTIPSPILDQLRRFHLRPAERS